MRTKEGDNVSQVCVVDCGEYGCRAGCWGKGLSVTRRSSSMPTLNKRFRTSRQRLWELFSA